MPETLKETWWIAEIVS